MSSFLMGFGAGVADRLATNINQRKDEARTYFDEQMKIARERAYQYKTEGQAKFKGALQVANQMKAAGVPDETIMRIANQNPDDLPEFYELVQKMKLDGVDTSDPEFYNNLFPIDEEFNPGQENVTSLLKKIYMPLSANVKADPEGFKLDPKGTVWATMMGYNAMERAQERLDSTMVVDGMSASDLIYNNPDNLAQPLGDTTIGLNAEFAGQAMRDANTGGPITLGQQLQLITAFQKWSEEEAQATMGTQMSAEQRQRVANQKAAQRIVDVFPEAAGISEISKWLSTGDEIIDGTIPFGDGGNEEGPYGGEAQTATEKPAEAPPAEEATTPSGDTPPLPQRLPNGATLVRDRGDGTSEWRMPDGTMKRVRNEEVFTMIGSEITGIPSAPPTMQEKPKAGWLEDQGKEYD